MRYTLKQEIRGEVASFMYLTDAKSFLEMPTIIPQEYELFCDETFICKGHEAVSKEYEALYLFVKQVMGWSK